MDEKMNVNSKSSTKQLKGEKLNRGAVTLYLNKSVYAAFRKACGDTPASQILEELLMKFIASVESNQSQNE